MAPTPVDRGWAWVILACSAVVVAFSGAFLKNFGILFSEILAKFDNSATSTAFIPSLHYGLMQFAVLPASYMCGRHSIMVTTMVGGFLYACGYCLTGFASVMEIMYITTAISGIGAGVAVTGAIVITGLYFDKHRAKAISFLTFCSGVVSSGFAYFYEYLFAEYGLTGALMLSSGIILQIIVASSFYRQPILPDLPPLPGNNTDQNECLNKTKNSDKSAVYVNETPNTDGDYQGTHENDSVDIERVPLVTNDVNVKSKPGRKIAFDPTILMDGNFLVILVSYLLAFSSYSMIIVVLPVFAEETTGDPSHKALSLVAFIATESIGKLLTGIIADTKKLRCRTIWSISITAAAVFMFSLAFAADIATIATLSVGMGLCCSVIVALDAILLIETMGLEKFTSAYGFANSFSVIGVLTIPLLAGYLRDTYGSWRESLIFAAILLLISALFVQILTIRELGLVARLVRRYQRIDVNDK